MKRARWLRRRRFAGRDRPRPVRFAVVNCASVSVDARRARSIWANALEVADVVLAMECSDVDASAPGWHVIQRGKQGSPESALVLAVRADRGEWAHANLDPGIAPTSEGGGIRRRPLLGARLTLDPSTPHKWSRRVLVGHAHPARAPKARRAYLRRFARMDAAIKGGDLNIGHRWAARLMGKRVHSAGVLHLAVPRWIPQTKPKRIDIGSDHPALVITLWRKQ